MLQNKVIVVTGGAGLIGQEFVKAIIKNNGVAVIADVNQEAGEALKIQLTNILRTDKIDFFGIDINSKESISELVVLLSKKYGRVDALVNNAYPRNKTYGQHFFDVEYESFCENINLNLGGYFLTSQQFAQFFKTQGYGNIVNIASVYGVIAPRFQIYENTHMTTPVEYAVIKSGLIHLTKYMAKYFSGMNIRVNAISPGGILDGQPESFLQRYRQLSTSKGMLDKKDLQGSLIYLLSDMSAFVNGQNIVVDDGFTL